MFCGQLVSSEIVPAHPRETAGWLLQQMDHFKTSHYPIADEEKFLGLVWEDDLLDVETDLQANSIADQYLKAFVHANDFFLVAVKMAHSLQLSLVPVLNDNQEFEGVITVETLFRELARTCGTEAYGSMIVLDVDPQHYSLGEMNRLVESNDATITQLNTVADPVSQLLTIIIRINKEEVSDIVATFQRHEYTVRYYLGEELFRNELQSNLDHLMNYLNI